MVSNNKFRIHWGPKLYPTGFVRRAHRKQRFPQALYCRSDTDNIHQPETKDTSEISALNRKVIGIPFAQVLGRPYQNLVVSSHSKKPKHKLHALISNSENTSRMDEQLRENVIRPVQRPLELPHHGLGKQCVSPLQVDSHPRTGLVSWQIVGDKSAEVEACLAHLSLRLLAIRDCFLHPFSQ